MPKLKPETTAARKAHILQSAMVCFARQGYHQTTMDDVVAEAGLSKGGLYVHFTSKKDLYLALFDWFVDEYELFSIPPTTGATAYERLTSVFHTMIGTASSDSFLEMSALMTDVWAQNSRDDDINRLMKKLYEKARTPLAQLIEEGIADGTFKAVDSLAMANIFIAVFEGLLIQTMVDPLTVDWAAVTATMETLLEGMLN